MASNNTVVRRFLKFCIVGISGTLIDFGITAVCKGFLGFPDLLANATGFVVASSINYILNRISTWRSKSGRVGAEYFKFFAVSLMGLSINSLIVALLHNQTLISGAAIMHVFSWFCTDCAAYFVNLDWNFWIAKVLATAVVMVWNFLANNFITFRK